MTDRTDYQTRSEKQEDGAPRPPAHSDALQARWNRVRGGRLLFLMAAFAGAVHSQKPGGSPVATTLGLFGRGGGAR